MSSSLRTALLCVASALPLSCSSAYTEDAGAELASSQSSLALISVERVVDSETQLPRLSASAKVARFQGIDGEGLLKLLGAELRDLETCGVASSLDDSVGVAAHVDLLSVGAISVRLGDHEHSLPPRLFPALATTAAGWFYAGARELPGPLGGNEDFALSASGEAGQGKFEAVGVSPAEVQGIALQGVPLESGSTLRRDEAVELTWEPEGVGDRIELEIFAGGGALSCAVRDDGHFALPRAQLRALPADDSASLLVRRVRVVPVEMTGIESAYARVATSRVFVLPTK